jgi:hypothetical protein
MGNANQKQVVLAGLIGGLVGLAALLAVAVVAVLLWGGPPATREAAAVQTPAKPPRAAIVRTPAQQKPISDEARATLEQVAEQINRDQAAAKEQRIIGLYVDRAMQRFHQWENPGEINRYIDPPLDPHNLSTGDIGTFAMIRVIQVLDDGLCIAQVDQAATVVIGGLDTTDLVDGKTIKGRDLVLEVFGPVSYQSVLGAKKTVMAVKAIDVIDVNNAREAARRRVREASKARSSSRPLDVPIGDLRGT